MFDNIIYHPQTGEKGFFVPEKDAELLKLIISDFKKNQMAIIMHQFGVDADE